jgi:hypothetical protein
MFTAIFNLYINVWATHSSWAWHELWSCSAIFWCILRFYHECKQQTPFDLLLKLGVYVENVVKIFPANSFHMCIYVVVTRKLPVVQSTEASRECNESELATTKPYLTYIIQLHLQNVQDFQSQVTVTCIWLSWKLTSIRRIYGQKNHHSLSPGGYTWCGREVMRLIFF